MVPWVFEDLPRVNKLTAEAKVRVEQRIMQHAAKKYANRKSKIEVRFRGDYCYIDAAEVDAKMPLVRLKYEGDENKWSLGFFTYSNDKYSACAFGSGREFGSPEEGLDVGAVYLE